MITAFEFLFLGGLITAFAFTLHSLDKEKTEARKRLYKRAELIGQKRNEGGLNELHL